MHTEDTDETEDDLNNSDAATNDSTSAASVIRSPPVAPGPPSRANQTEPSYRGPTFTKSEIDRLVNLMESTVKLSPEIRAYLHDIVVFLRLHRAVQGGISALATRHLLKLSQ
jgi:hypothetical protein